MRRTVGKFQTNTISTFSSRTIGIRDSVNWSARERSSFFWDDFFFNDSGRRKRRSDRDFTQRSVIQLSFEIKVKIKRHANIVYQRNKYVEQSIFTVILFFWDADYRATKANRSIHLLRFKRIWQRNHIDLLQTSFPSSSRTSQSFQSN